MSATDFDAAAMVNTAIKKKLTRYDDRSLCGKLSPAEIIALIGAGCTPTPRSERLVAWLANLPQERRQEEWWFYFRAPAGLDLILPMFGRRA